MEKSMLLSFKIDFELVDVEYLNVKITAINLKKKINNIFEFTSSKDVGALRIVFFQENLRILLRW